MDNTYCRSLFPTFALNVQKYNLKGEPAVSSTHIPNPCSPNLLISTPWKQSPGYQGEKPLIATAANHKNFHCSLVAAHITHWHRHWLSYNSITGCLATKLHHLLSPFGQLSITHMSSTKVSTLFSECLILRSEEPNVICCPLDNLPLFLQQQCKQHTHNTPNNTNTHYTTSPSTLLPCIPILLNLPSPATHL